MTDEVQVMRLGVIGIVSRPRDEILLCRTTRRGWSLPGGFLAPGESPTTALRREVAEETGIACVVTDIVATCFSVEQGICSIVVRGSSTSGSLRPDGSEVLEARWCGAEAARHDIESESHRLFLGLGGQGSGPVICWYSGRGGRVSSLETSLGPDLSADLFREIRRDH
jgi:ADP-ribose pyrophosphatase YjhB (NUDIX family)